MTRQHHIADRSEPLDLRFDLRVFEGQPFGRGSTPNVCLPSRALRVKRYAVPQHKRPFDFCLPHRSRVLPPPLRPACRPVHAPPAPDRDAPDRAGNAYSTCRPRPRAISLPAPVGRRRLSPAILTELACKIEKIFPSAGSSSSDFPTAGDDSPPSDRNASPRTEIFCAPPRGNIQPTLFAVSRASARTRRYYPFALSVAGLRKQCTESSLEGAARQHRRWHQRF